VNLFTAATTYAATNPQGPLNGSPGSVALAPFILAASTFDPTVQNWPSCEATGVEDS
jgi:hypothetical protein